MNRQERRAQLARNQKQIRADLRTALAGLRSILAKLKRGEQFPPELLPDVRAKFAQHERDRDHLRSTAPGMFADLAADFAAVDVAFSQLHAALFAGESP